MSIRTEILTLSALPAFVESARFQQLPAIPISPQRALSYAHHPLANPDDKVLYLAWISDQLVGYRLILPDVVHLPAGQQQVGWYSCVWVQPNHRGKGIAKQLVEQTMADWGGQILYQNPAPASHQLYQRTGRFADYALPGQRWYHRFHLAEIWARKKGKRHFLMPALHLLDGVANWVIHPVLQRPLPTQFNPTEWQEVDVWSPDALDFIQQQSKQQLFQRSAAEWQWITAFPWVEEGPADQNSKRYYFSAKAHEYRQQRIEFNASGTIIGALFTRRWNGHLDVLYWWGDATAAERAVHYLGFQIKKKAVRSLTVFQPVLRSTLQQRHTGFAFTKSIARHYYYPKEWSIGNRVIQAGDGDGVFT